MNVIIINLILAIPTFFLVILISKKSNPTWNRLRNPLLWLTTFFVTPIVYVGLIFTWISIETYYPEKEFDKEKWAENVEKRYKYADDLVDNEKLIGLTRQEIKEILGEPEYESKSSMTYYIGFSPRHIFGIDPDYLEIEFKNEKAHKTRIYNSWKINNYDCTTKNNYWK